jgi:hypothetical protein
MKRKFADMFVVPPNTWGARGEPYFWEDLRGYYLKNEMPLPDRFEVFMSELHATFEQLTAHSISEREWFFIEKYAHGGMSSGGIDPVGWREGGKIYDYFQGVFSTIKEADALVSARGEIR